MSRMLDSVTSAVQQMNEILCRLYDSSILHCRLLNTIDVQVSRVIDIYLSKMLKMFST